MSYDDRHSIVCGLNTNLLDECDCQPMTSPEVKELEYVRVVIETRWDCENPECQEENENSNFGGEDFEFPDQDGIIICKFCSGYDLGYRNGMYDAAAKVNSIIEENDWEPTP